MTPEQRAEKITVFVEHNMNIGCKPLIAAEIRAAVEEAVGWVARECDKDLEPLIYAAKAEAYEDAAKIAEVPLCKNDSHCAWICEDIAAHIRARAVELSTTTDSSKISSSDYKNCAKLNFIGKLDPLPFQWDDDAEVGK